MHNKHNNSKCDPFYLHRLALTSLLTDAHELELQKITRAIEYAGLGQFLSFIGFNGLVPLWHELLSEIPGTTATLDNIKTMLHQDRMDAVVAYLLQKHTLDKLHNIFTNENIRYAVFKGAQVRELVYPEPALRPASDTDILIHADDRDKAIHVLSSAGMQLNILAENFSHECTLMDNIVQIDLHWHILRPGRIRPGISNELLNDPKMINGFSGMNECATMFVLLVHPAYTRHVCNPYATLIRIVDLIRLINANTIDWPRVIDLISRAHARTAAWTTLFWINHLVACEQLQEIMDRLAPHAIQRRYLEYWIVNNLPSRLVAYRKLMHLSFTLTLHDSFKDAMNAIIAWRGEMRRAQNEYKCLTGNNF